ncbi:hypothetical protein JAAARDRAFT_389250 [Jaapia argillacea MUCL 33604]|uniref:Fungal lipase-type domain-containing protein n=1 Tax=Jaapia argillacea MUCL 33604 TaxID=933084 RepID=A0A067Q9T6_9AGAM|nr:hypothetical protein JAAARDRAFT_389250 [Jaapia argillacea MUCL 33604]
MVDRLKGLFDKGWRELTPTQQRMYARESLVNFRYIAKICSTRSPYTLTSADLVSTDLSSELSEFGQFAELAYNNLPIPMIFDSLDMLSRTDFPLESFDALEGSELVGSFKGKVAAVPAFVAYRPRVKQLVVSISGTKTLKQGVNDCRNDRKHHPVGKGCKVHVGFWKMYKGLKPFLIDALKKGLKEKDVETIVLTGHSMGGALCYLLAIDLLIEPDKDLVPPGTNIKLASFGSPRVGDEKLVKEWRALISAYRSKYGTTAFQEYHVKGYNDGVPSIPPRWLGFRTFAESPLYFVAGRLYRVPPSENEHGSFNVSLSPSEKAFVDYPRGGHNYYNNRDMEKFGRRMKWLDELMQRDTGTGWEEKYLRRVGKRERGWEKKVRKAKAKADAVMDPSTSASSSGDGTPSSSRNGNGLDGLEKQCNVDASGSPSHDELSSATSSETVGLTPEPRTPSNSTSGIATKEGVVEKTGGARNDGLISSTTETGNNGQCADDARLTLTNVVDRT